MSELVVDRVLNCFELMCGTRPTLETNIESLGIDSLDVAELLFDVESMLDVEVDAESMENLLTVGDVTNLFSRLTSAA